MAQTTEKVQAGFAFHLHHGILFEWCADYEERRQFIEENKPKEEQGLRLRLFQLIPQDRVPASLVAAWTTYIEANVTFSRAVTFDSAMVDIERAWTAKSKAWTAYKETKVACQKEIQALHAELCPDCPWDGFTIFREVN